MLEENKVNWSEIEKAGKTKPLGITLLVILHAIGSLFIIPSFLMLLSVKDEVDSGLEEFGFSLTDVAAGLLLVAFLTVGSAIGLYLGKRWGWWMASYYYLYSAAQRILAFITAFQMSDQLGASEVDIQSLAVKTFPRVVFKLLILFYLFRPQVWNYFELTRIRKWTALGLLLGVYIALTAFFSVLSYALA